MNFQENKETAILPASCSFYILNYYNLEYNNYG